MNEFLLVAGMAAVTFAVRWPVLTVVGRIPLPQPVLDALKFIPPAVLTAIIQLMLKVMSRRDSTETLVAWNLIVSVPLALGPALWFWSTPTAGQWGLLLAQGALGALNQSVVTRAFQLADASVVAPMDFLRLPFVAIAAFAFFGEVAGISTWVGAAVIFVATLMMAASRRTS